MAKGNIVLFYPGYKSTREYEWFPFPYLYIGPFLEKAGFRVSIIDARVEADWKNTLRRSLNDAFCLGVTAMSGPDIEDAVLASKICKEINHNLPVIWGGPHATAQPEQTLEQDYIDTVVIGQGENAMAQIAENIYRHMGFLDIPGIVYKKNGVIHKNLPSRIISFSYDVFPGFNLIDIEKYRSPNNIASMFTARSCPFNCTFCTTKDKGYSERTFEQIKKEMTFFVKRLNFKNIFFQDGTFFVKKKRVMQIANWLIESGLQIKWKAKARAGSLSDYTEQELSMLKRSGLVSLFFGLESGSERILKNMHKDTTPHDAEKSAQICSTYDIEFYTSFMFATPGETLDDIHKTIKHIKRLKKINKKTIVQNCIYIPLPATPMFEEACRSGYRPPSKLEEWAKRDISSRFEKRDDISWIPSGILKEYIKIYNNEFVNYKHLYEREKEGTYISVFEKKPSNNGAGS